MSDLERERGAGTPSARSGGGGWWSKVAGTAKGGVTGGSEREGGARAGARVCPAAAGQGCARRPRGEKGWLRPGPPAESRELAGSARRQCPASRRGTEAGARGE